MARARVSSSLLKRMAALDGADDESLGPGVMVVPPIMDLDAWEAIAMPMQAAAFEAAREDTETRHVPSVTTAASPATPSANYSYGVSLQTGKVLVARPVDLSGGSTR